MKILIESIPHSEQRYDTVGDWQWPDEENHPLRISVSDMFYKYKCLIAVHELIEAILCAEGTFYSTAILQEAVDSFDKNWKPHDDITEPGDDPNAPYHRQHMFASLVERMLAAEMGISWGQYEKAINKLEWKPKPANSIGSPWWWEGRGNEFYCSRCKSKQGTDHDLKKHDIDLTKLD